MNTADRWCAGFVPQGPHVPDGELVETNIGPDVRLCGPCWRRWIREDWRPNGAVDA